MEGNQQLNGRKLYLEELNGVETEDDIITPIATNHALLSQSRRGRRQTLAAVTDSVNMFRGRNVLSPRLGKRSPELNHKWKTRRNSEFFDSGQDWLFSLHPNRKWSLPSNHPFLLVEIELENGSNLTFFFIVGSGIKPISQLASD